MIDARSGLRRSLQADLARERNLCRSLGGSGARLRARHDHDTGADGDPAIEVRDVVIGMSDGLTVPFALAAGLTGGLTGTANPSTIIVTASLAEIAAGSIAMGLGGYLAAKSDAEHYASEREREYREVQEIPEEEMREVAEVFESYGLTREETWPIVQALRKLYDAGLLADEIANAGAR